MKPGRMERLRCGAFVLVLACAANASAAPEMGAFIGRYCIDCHDGGVKRGGLDLEAIGGKDVGAHRDIWEHVIRRMGARQMPPPEEERPDEETYREVIKSLEAHFDALAARDPEPGHVPAMRRMTRTEYRHAIRDLLEVDLDVAEMLPPDESSHGIDNITVGSLSPTLLSRYINAAQKISRLAVGADPGQPDVRVVRVPADRTQEEWVVGLPLGTRGGILIDHKIKGRTRIGVENS